MKKLLILAALLTAPVAAHAEPAQRLMISSAGLDLSKPADAAAMIRRIEAAARPMCMAPGFANRRSTAGCIHDVTRDAVRNLRIPELNTAFEQRSARPAQG
jgi:UrcA family protein